MFTIAILIGTYAYSLFALGLLGFLQKPFILFDSLVFFLFFFLICPKPKRANIRTTFEAAKNNTRFFFFFLLFLALLVVTFVGTLGPELSFDALWYHLTLPKLWLQEQRIWYVPGGLLYYTAMPKLGELLYVPALALQGEILAKVVHFLFGVGVCLAIYKISKMYTSSFFALLATLVFFSNIVVSWEATTAYIDLVRAFYEVLALGSFLIYKKTKHMRWILLTGILLGFAVTSKLLALGSLSIFILLLGYLHIPQKAYKQFVVTTFFLVGVMLLMPLSWFLFAYIHTGNPIYPFFTNLYPVFFFSGERSFFLFPYDIFLLFVQAADPVSPLYLVFLPLLFVAWKKLSKEARVIALYCALALVVWYLTPQTGGGRFILPYLPAFSILVALVLAQFQKQRFFYRFLLFLVVFNTVITIGFRGIANARFLPVILGTESKEEFLTNNLNFSFGDFYDTDGFFKNSMKPSDTVLLYGSHNLYYVDFPFIHESWVKKGDTFNYIAVQEGVLPKRFSDWEKIHYNAKTGVSVYKKGNTQWVY